MKGQQEAFDHNLARSLDDLVRTGDKDATVRRHPEQAELLETAARLTSYYAWIPEPPTDLSKGRARVLQAAAQQRPPVDVKRKTFWGQRGKRWWNWRFAFRLMAVVLILLLTIMPVGTRVVWAANESIPGQPLYKVKLTTEDLHFTSIDDPELKVMLALAFTDERIDEFQELLARQRPIPDAALERMQLLARYTLESAAWTSDTAINTMLEFIIRRTQVQVERLESLKGYAADDLRGELAQAQVICMQSRMVALIALDKPQAFQAVYRVGRPERIPLPAMEPLPTGDMAPTSEDDEDLLNVTVAAEPTLKPVVEPSAAAVTGEARTHTPDPTFTASPEPTLEAMTARISPTLTLTPTFTPTISLPTVAAASKTPESDDSGQGNDNNGNTGSGSEPDAHPGGHPETPPGLVDKPAQPPGQDNRPPDAPGQDKPKKNK